MSTAPQHKRTRSSTIKLGLVLLLIAVPFVLVYLDGRYRGNTYSGYVPEGASIVASVQDFPTFWSDTQKHRLGELAQTHLSRELFDLQSSIRLETGVRPTPERMALYLGNTVFAAQSEGSWGFSTRPGLLLRVLHYVYSAFNTPQDDIYQYGSYAYTLKGDHLLLSEDIDWVKQARSATLTSHPASETNTLDIRTASGLELHLSAFHQGVIHGQWPLAKPVPESNGALPAIPFQGNSLITAATNNWPLALQLLDQGMAEFPQSFQEAWGAPEHLQPLREALQLDHYLMDAPPGVWALSAMDMQSPKPVPQFTWLFEKQDSMAHPFGPMLESFPAIPALWNGQSGHRIPLLGEAFTMCLTENERAWIATTHARHVTSSQSYRHLGTSSSVALRLQMHWNHMAPYLSALQPKPTAHDTQQVDWSSWQQFLAALGYTEIQCTLEEGHITFQGTLQKDSRSQASRPTSTISQTHTPAVPLYIAQLGSYQEQIAHFSKHQHPETGALPMLNGLTSPEHITWMVAILCLQGKFEEAQAGLEFLSQQIRLTEKQERPAGSLARLYYLDGTPYAPYYEVHLESTALYLSALDHFLSRAPEDLAQEFMASHWESIQLGASFLARWDHPDPTLVLPSFNPDAGYDQVRRSTSLLSLMGLDCAARLARVLEQDIPEAWQQQAEVLETRIRAMVTHDADAWTLDRYHAWWVREHMHPDRLPPTLRINDDGFEFMLLNTALPIPLDSPQTARECFVALYGSTAQTR